MVALRAAARRAAIQLPRRDPRSSRAGPTRARRAGPRMAARLRRRARTTIRRVPLRGGGRASEVHHDWTPSTGRPSASSSCARAMRVSKGLGAGAPAHRPGRTRRRGRRRAEGAPACNGPCAGRGPTPSGHRLPRRAQRGRRRWPPPAGPPPPPGSPGPPASGLRRGRRRPGLGGLHAAQARHPEFPPGHERRRPPGASLGERGAKGVDARQGEYRGQQGCLRDADRLLRCQCTQAAATTSWPSSSGPGPRKPRGWRPGPAAGLGGLHGRRQRRPGRVDPGSIASAERAEDRCWSTDARSASAWARKATARATSASSTSPACFARRRSAPSPRPARGRRPRTGGPAPRPGRRSRPARPRAPSPPGAAPGCSPRHPPALRRRAGRPRCVRPSRWGRSSPRRDRRPSPGRGC